MIYVMHGNSVEPLVDYNNLSIDSTVEGDLTASFSSVNTEYNTAHPLLVEESIISIDDYEFKVKQINEKATFKSITAVSTFYDMYGVYRHEIFGGTRTINEYLNYLLNGTGWTTRVTFNASATIPNFGANNVIDLLHVVCEAFECEYEIKPNKVLQVSKKLGGSHDKQYRYGYNVKSFNKKTDTTKLATYIQGFGEGYNVSYTSPNEAVFGKIEADPVHSDEYATRQDFINYLKTQIVDVPEISFDLDAVELLDTELGESVWLIYEPLGIELETRILGQFKTIIDNEMHVYKVTLGNSIPYDINDAIIEQGKELEEEKDRTRSKFEQTDDRITLEVENIGKSIASLNIRADQIDAKVANNAGSIASLTIRADSIQSQVTNNNNNTQSQISQMSNQINLKVTKGQSISDINITPYGVTINADKINFNGAVIANGTITGNSSINVGTDLFVGNNVYLANGRNSNKSIVFGNVARIDGDWSNIRVSAPNVRIESNVTIGGGSVDFSGRVNFAYAQVIGVARAGSSGIGISTNGSSLFVQVDGRTIGSVKLT